VLLGAVKYTPKADAPILQTRQKSSQSLQKTDLL